MTGIGTLFMCNQALPRARRWTTVHPPPCRHLGLLELPAIAQVRAQRGRIDLGLLLPPLDGAEIITDPVWSEEWLAALPKAHPLVRRTKLHATDFAGRNDTLHVNVRTIAEVEHLNIILGARDRQPGGRPGPQPDGAIAVTRCWPPVSSTPTEDASSID
jgi:DNA-binding transcriptional LysR family regulator